MSLRERNAAQTRELVLDAALELFLARGYEHTRMDEIAEAAGIGASTLYRYFPTKDSLVVGPLAIRDQMAEELRARPPEEPLELALGHALTALLTTPRPGGERLVRLFEVLRATPALRIRLLEQYADARAALALALAERLGRPPGDVHCAMTASLTMSLLELLGERPSVSEDNATAIRESLDYLRTALEQLRAEPPALPHLL